MWDGNWGIQVINPRQREPQNSDKNTTLSVNRVLLHVKSYSKKKKSLPLPEKENPVSKQLPAAYRAREMGRLLSKTKIKILPASECRPKREKKTTARDTLFHTPCQPDCHINSSNQNPRAQDASRHNHWWMETREEPLNCALCRDQVSWEDSVVKPVLEKLGLHIVSSQQTLQGVGEGQR